MNISEELPRNRPRCILYTRVSSERQTDGTSLATQEQVCRQYAEREGFEVVRTFEEAGASAKVWQRPQLMAALEFLKSQEQVQYFITFKIDRLSRNTEDLFVIMRALREANVELRSASEAIDSSPAGQLLRDMLWSFATFDNRVRAERCRAGSVARFKQGYWVHTPPPGYYMQKDPETGRSNLTPDPKRAEHIKWAFEQRANGMSYGEIAKALAARGYRHKSGGIANEGHVERFLANPIYMGLMRAFGEEQWGKFPPLVSKELWRKVQQVTKERARALPKRVVHNPLYPLRRFVYCSACGQQLTGSAPRGRNKVYPIYHHHNHDCPKAKSIPIETLTKKFEAVLTSLKPTSRRLKEVKKVVLAEWQHRIEQHQKTQSQLNNQINHLLSEKKNLMALKRQNPAMYSDQEFLEQKRELTGKINNLEIKRQEAVSEYQSLDTELERAFVFLQNPLSAWQAMDVISKSEFQYLLMPKKLPFDGELFGTTEKSVLVGLLTDKRPKSDKTDSPDSHVVQRVGVEPTWEGFTVLCMTGLPPLVLSL